MTSSSRGIPAAQRMWPLIARQVVVERFFCCFLFEQNRTKHQNKNAKSKKKHDLEGDFIFQPKKS